jgi:hypothetical protein
VRRRTQLHRSSRTSTVELDPDSAWRVVAGAGPGEHWYVDALPWIFRGGIDRLIGGDGRRYPVPDHPHLEAGDRAGFWRVHRLSDPRRTVRFEAEVVAPGRVLMDAEVRPAGDGTAVTTAITFEPDGLLGQLYMYVDLAARETVTELAHRRLLEELGAA